MKSKLNKSDLSPGQLLSEIMQANTLADLGQTVPKREKKSEPRYALA